MRTFLLSILLIFNIDIISAQQSIKEIIGSMPENIVPYLKSEQTAGLKSIIENGDTVKIKNALNGTTSVDSIATDFAKLKLNEIADLQIRLLPYNDTTSVICLVKTINKPVKESTVMFFSTEWKKSNNDFGLPKTDETATTTELFTQRPDSMSIETYEELIDSIDPIIIHADISAPDNTITFSLSLPFTTKEERKKTEAIIRQNTFKWEGNTFKKC